MHKEKQVFLAFNNLKKIICVFLRPIFWHLREFIESPKFFRVYALLWVCGALQRTGGAPDRTGGALERNGGAREMSRHVFFTKKKQKEPSAPQSP